VGRLTLGPARRALSLRPVTKALPARVQKVLRLTLPRPTLTALRQALARRARPVVTLKLTARDRTGKTVAATRRVMVKP
jgi:hypothetical protein